MKKIRNAITILIFFIIVSCQKKLPKCGITYGQVRIEIKDGIPLYQIKGLFVKLNIEYSSLGNFLYTKTIPVDSQEYYSNLINSRRYIMGSCVATKYAQDSFTRFGPIGFNNLNEVNYANWDSVVVKEKLLENTIPSEPWNPRGGIICIPTGKEEYWINILKNCPEINSADYAYIQILNCVK